MDRAVIDTAFVSGRLGQAIYRQGDQFYAIGPDGHHRLASAAEVREITSFGAEYQLVRQRSAESVQDELRQLISSYNALFLAVSLLNPELSLSTRIVAAQSLESMLGEVAISKFVGRRVLSVPLPTATRAHRHEIVSPWAEFAHLKSLLSELFESQPVLDELWAAWSTVCEEFRLDETVRGSLDAALVSSGFFSDCAQAIAGRDYRELNSAVVRHATGDTVSHETGVSQSLLTAFRSVVYGKFFASPRKPVQRPLRLRKRKHAPSADLDEPVDTITKLIQEFEASDSELRPHLGAIESKARVDKQISAIRDVIFAGKNALAERYLEDLIAFQLGQGDREYAGMSLCALTAISLDANQFDMADRLSLYALKLAPDDRVVYTSRAEVFKRRGHFDAALKAYEESLERYRRDRWSLNGYADVLKEKGLYAESLAKYKQTQTEFQDDPVAFNGEVSVLRASARPREALNLAIKYAKRFDYDAVTRATLARCLADVGKFDEAVRQYRAAINLDSSEVIIHSAYIYVLRESGNLEGALRHSDWCVRKFPGTPRIYQLKATLLRNSERFSEAETIYRRLIETYPTYTPARIGLAALQVLQRKAEEARQNLPEQNMESELDWFGFRIRALSHASEGEYPKAEPILSFSLKECPWRRERVKAETALALVELQRGDFRKSIGLLHKNISGLEYVDQQTRLVLLAHAQAESGGRDVARVLLGRLLSSKEATINSVRDDVTARYSLGLPTSTSTTGGVAQIAARELSLAMAA